MIIFFNVIVDSEITKSIYKFWTKKDTMNEHLLITKLSSWVDPVLNN